MKRNYKCKYFCYNILHGGIAEFVFDEAGKATNKVSMSMLLEFEKVLDELAKAEGIKAILFKSGKKDVFISGNDIKEIRDIKFETEAIDISKKGQEIFSKIESLPFPSIAVIDGECIDGGLELALACSFRIVSDNPEVRLGFSFAGLGLIPFFGGCVRFPKIAGIGLALRMTLNNVFIDGKKAWQTGIADRYYPQGFLNDKVTEFVGEVIDLQSRKNLVKNRGKIRFFRWVKESNFISRRLIALRNKRKVLREKHKFYPALLATIDVLTKSLLRLKERGLAMERKIFGRLAVSDVSKRLIDAYVSVEKIKLNYVPDKRIGKILESKKVRDVCVIGVGEMGGEIAWLFSNAEIHMRMKDSSRDVLKEGYHSVYEIYSEEYGKNCLEDRECKLKLHRITATLDFSGFKQADFIIENIEENKEHKIKLLRELEDKVGKDTIIATNTSVFSVGELATHLKYPERFLGLHFFSPVSKIPLVEVIKGKKTSDFAIAFAMEISRKVGKIPVVVKDCHGFLVNRIVGAGLNEAFIMLQEGYEFWKIDLIVKNFGFSLGPFALVDKIGVRKFNKMLKTLLSAYPDRMEQTKIFDKIVENSRFESKEKIFYVCRGSREKPNPELVSFLREKGFSGKKIIKNEEVLGRFVMRMINEAAFCIEEGIIDNPEYLDLSLLLSNNFPYFRGGILRYADDFGLEKIIDQLQEYEMRFGKRFVPCGLLHKLRIKESGFYSR